MDQENALNLEFWDFRKARNAWEAIGQRMGI